MDTRERLIVWVGFPLAALAGWFGAVVLWTDPMARLAKLEADGIDAKARLLEFEVARLEATLNQPLPEDSIAAIVSAIDRARQDEIKEQLLNANEINRLGHRAAENNE